MLTVTPTQRRSLRARAHGLDPVVAIGQHGLTPAVLHEIDVALRAHELVKVRVFGDDRAARVALLARICEALECAPVQHIGKLLVLWRPDPDGKVAREAERAAAPRAVRAGDSREARAAPAPAASRRRRRAPRR